jgi:predicted NBD/HSP70 family sugar kinase
MLIAVDVGGTKTLVALIDRHNNIIHEIKFATNASYSVFIGELYSTICELEGVVRRAEGGEISAKTVKQEEIYGCVIALPGQVDRKRGMCRSFGNLDWKNVSIVHDLTKLGLKVPMVVENDANLAGLAEAQEHPNQLSVAYITVSTGIGSGYMYKGRLNPTLLDAEAGQMLVPDPTLEKFVPWEKIASGKFISQHFHQLASNISDPDVWDDVAHRLVPGFSAIIANIRPEVIVVGGGAGQALANFKPKLVELLKESFHPMINIPQIVVAEHPEKAVLYGCYYLGVQTWKL